MTRIINPAVLTRMKFWRGGTGFKVSRASPYSGVVIWAAVILLFGLIVPDTFLTVLTIRTVVSDQAITAIMALALLVPLACGVFDLSIGAMMGLSVVLVAYLQSTTRMPWGAAILLTLLCGAAVGAANAFVVVILRVDSFIATLGASSILLAAIEGVSGGNEIITGISQSFTNLAAAQILTISLPFFYMLVLAAVIWYLLEHRKTGRYLYATGSNLQAARLAGVPTDRLRFFSLVVSATIASLAGIIYTAKVGSGSPDAGTPYLLPAFAGAFLGATQIKPGRFNVPGTLVAVFLLGTGVKGLQLAGQPFWVEDIFTGVALIIAVAMAGMAERRAVGKRRRPADNADSPTTAGSGGRGSANSK